MNGASSSGATAGATTPRWPSTRSTTARSGTRRSTWPPRAGGHESVPSSSRRACGRSRSTTSRTTRGTPGRPLHVHGLPVGSDRGGDHVNWATADGSRRRRTATTTRRAAPSRSRPATRGDRHGSRQRRQQVRAERELLRELSNAMGATSPTVRARGRSSTTTRCLDLDRRRLGLRGPLRPEPVHVHRVLSNPSYRRSWSTTTRLTGRPRSRTTTTSRRQGRPCS